MVDNAQSKRVLAGMLDRMRAVASELSILGISREGGRSEYLIISYLSQHNISRRYGGSGVVNARETNHSVLTD